MTVLPLNEGWRERGREGGGEGVVGEGGEKIHQGAVLLRKERVRAKQEQAWARREGGREGGRVIRKES